MVISGFAYSQEYSIFSKVFRGPEDNAPGYNAISRSNLIIDSSEFQNGNVVLLFNQLGIIPANFKKRRTGIRLMGSIHEDPCDSVYQIRNFIDRNEIRKQLLHQQDSFLKENQIEKFDEIFRTSVERAFSILKNDSGSLELKNRSFQADEVEKFYKNALQDAFQVFRSQTQSPLLLGRLDREEMLAFRSMDNEVERTMRQRKVFTRYIRKGKGNPGYLSKRTWKLYLGKKSTSPEDPSLDIIYKKGVSAEVQFDTLPAYHVHYMDQVDSFNCVPVHRFLYYKHLPGYPFNRSTYKNRYHPGTTRTRFRTFTLFFEHNKSDYSRDDIKPILNFLNDSSYVVDQAKVQGFASVEGDSLNNQRLQVERAQILIDLIQKEQEEDSIELLSIATQENWDMFFDQIKKSPFSDWENKSKEDIKSLLENDSIAALMEPILSPERRSVLMLKVREKLDDGKKAEYSYRDFTSAIQRYYSSPVRQVRISNLNKAAQIRSWVRDTYREGNFSGDPCQFFKERTSDLDIIDFYEMREDLQKGLEPICQSINDIVRNAHQSIVFQIYSSSKENYPALLRQAVDIQNFIFDGLLSGLLPPGFLDLLEYPRQKKFHYLILNSYYFKHYDAYEMTKKYDPSYFVELPRNVHPVKDLYYYILKEIVLHDEFGMIRIDPEYFQFEVYEFLAWFSVAPWNEVQGIFFDDEVNEKVMLEQLNRLLDMNTILCDRQVYQLFLDYHIKAALFHYLKEGPDNPSTLASLGQLYHYFYQRRDHLNVKSTLDIVHLFLWYAHNTGNRDLLLYAYDILESQFYSGVNDPQVKSLYMKVKSFYPDRFRNQFARDRQKFSKTEWCNLFFGKHDINLLQIPVIAGDTYPSCFPCR